MNKFRNPSRGEEKISTSSLPDIVFLLLLFFMMSATIKTDEKDLKIKLPEAKALTEIDRRELIKELKVGYDDEGKLSLKSESRYLTLEDVSQWILSEKEKMPENLQNQLIVMIKADENVKMGVISDIQEKLRKVNARKVLFRSLKKGDS